MEIKDKISLVGGLMETAAYVSMEMPSGIVTYLDIENTGKPEKLSPGELPTEVVPLGVKTKVIESETRVRSAKIPMEVFADLSAITRISPLAETERGLYNEMKTETQMRLYKKYKSLGEISAESQKSKWTKWVEKLFKTSFPTYTPNLATHLAKRSNQIAHKTRRGPANFVIVNPTMAWELEKSNAYEFAKIDTSLSHGFDRVGYLMGIVVYVNRFQSVHDNTVIIGRSTKASNEPGVYFCEYTNEFLSMEDTIERVVRVQLRSRNACVEVGNSVSDGYITENIIVGKTPWWRRMFGLR
jgi:hypothetical protein